jgi:PAS domain S-box-containing protein
VVTIGGVDAAARLRALLQQAPIIHFALDQNGVFEVYEGSGTLLIGRRDHELVGRTVDDALAGQPELIANIRRALAGESFRAELEVRGVWFSIQYVPLHDENGAVDGMVGFATDVSERRRREEALVESEERYRQLSEAAFEAVAITDEGIIIDANSCLAQMFGYAPSELIGMSALRMCAPESRPLVAERILSGYDRAYEATGLRKDGSTFVGELRGKLGHYHGRPVRITAIRDLTERAELLAKEQAARATAEEALRIREEFLSIASHELGSPLTALRARVEQLSFLTAGDRPFDRARHEELVGLCLRQVHRLSYLVRDLLDVTRIRTGQLSIDRRRVDLTALVREVLARMSEELARAQCPLEQRLPAHPVEGQWDRVRLEQVLVNLVGNAAKFGAGQPIAISLEEVGEGAAAGPVRLVVTDHGIGIAPEQQARIFDRFERGDVQPQRYAGLGLGLYITRRIVEAHGGTVCVASAPGQGARFQVDLPR